MINWINAEDEVPQMDGVECPLCYVHIKYIVDGKEQQANVYDWYYYNPVDGGYWMENEGQVTHWMYASEIPFPE